MVLLVAALVLPALNGPYNAIQLTGSAEIVTGELLLARQTAVSRDLPVEVRIYQSVSNGPPAWNILALVFPGSVLGGGNDRWLDSPRIISGGIIIDPAVSEGGDAFSTLVSKGLTTPAGSSPTQPPIAPWTAVEADTAPPALRGLTYVAFRFQPDGSTNLPAQDAAGNGLTWSLTLRSNNAATPSSRVSPARDWIAIVLDPLTGRAASYRPS